MKAIEVITSSLQVFRERGNLIMKYGFDKSNPSKIEIAELISYSRNDRESSILQSQIYTRPERSFSARFVIS